MFNIVFDLVGRRGARASDLSLLDRARQLSVDLVSICGGIGNCERCKVQVISGKVTKPTLEEEASLSQKDVRELQLAAVSNFNRRFAEATYL